MTGWVHIKNDLMGHYRAAEKPTSAEWPPKFHKFILELVDSTNEVAFVDMRRLARIRLIDHLDGHDLRNIPPLSDNGPDPVLEPVSLQWLRGQLEARKVPVKAWLLDQSAIAGIGNWVGDEILYHARIHPETYTNTLSEEQSEKLHKALCDVTKLAVDTEADTSKFPDNWLMLHRWGKGKGKGRNGKLGNKLPTGEKVEFLTVGGRTSAFVPSLQKAPKGARKKAVKKGKAKESEDEDEDDETKTENNTESKAEDDAEAIEDEVEQKPAKKVSKRKAEGDSLDGKPVKPIGGEPTKKAKKTTSKAKKEKVDSLSKKETKPKTELGTIGLRRSSRKST